jgi:hypothetical protein
MQAIVTKFLSPTNVKHARVKATCQAGSVTLSWDHALNPEANHRTAAMALVKKQDWFYGDWIGGGLPDGNMVWVCRDATIERLNSAAAA